MKLEIEELSKTDLCDTKKLTDLIEYRKKMLDIIFRIKDSVLRTILISYYINGNTWEEVSDNVNYNLRYTQKLHNKAIEILQNKKGD